MLGVTQELIDQTRLSGETAMLADLRGLALSGGDLAYRGRNGETPVRSLLSYPYPLHEHLVFCIALHLWDCLSQILIHK